MEVFLVYKQFCNIKSVLSKSYDTLSFEDQLKMYNPFILSLNEILGSDNIKIEQEGGEGGSAPAPAAPASAPAPAAPAPPAPAPGESKGAPEKGKGSAIKEAGKALKEVRGIKGAMKAFKEGKKQAEVQNDEPSHVRIDKPPEEDSFKDFFKALKHSIIEIFVMIKEMFLAVVLFLVYTGLYPAVPFFAVLSAGLAGFKYILFKFRKL